MKSIAIAAGCLLSAGLPVGMCASVEVLILQPSSQHVLITVLQDAEPVQKVAIVVSGANHGRPRFSLVTGSHGVAKLPTLPPGNYCVTATATPTLRADLCLAVSKRFGKKTSSFSMDLMVKPPLPPTLEERVEAAENTPATARLQEFQGVVRDPSGAGIPQTRIEIFHKGSRAQALVAKTKSDANGHFSVHLEDGFYTAIVQLPGFATQIVIFEIGRDGDPKDLQVTLQLAPST